MPGDFWGTLFHKELNGGLFTGRRRTTDNLQHYISVAFKKIFATSAASQIFLVLKDAGTEARTVVVLILTVRAAYISSIS